MFVVSGRGQVSVPCLWFEDRATAEEYLNHTQGLTRREGKDVWEVSGGFDWHKFFIRYYDGCGAVHVFVLEEVSPGTPFEQWDLD